MGNSLLDFVMSLVRDPAAAARYAADPAGTLAAAGLPGVTIADVQSLIPVVTDSLATSTPSFGDAFDAANVWSSGAAAAALDAFHLPHPAPVMHEPSPQIDAGVIAAPAPGPAAYPAVDEPLVDPGLAPAPAVAGSFDHAPLDPVGAGWGYGDGSPDGWHHQPQDLQPDHPVDHPGFELF